MARGIERAPIFRDDADRNSFLVRLGKIVASGAIEVFAWALLPNHFHLLLKTRLKPLSLAMRSLLTGHATHFNRRHDRAGHVFQNRYRSIVCEEESYFLELVRYIHLNPIRAGIVESLTALDSYRYAGHSAVLGIVTRRWQATDFVLGQFGKGRRFARMSYRDFVAAGVDHGRRPDLQGGGLIRSAGNWAAVRELRRAREAFKHDERVLGGSSFVESLLRAQLRPQNLHRNGLSLEQIIGLVCAATKVDVGSLRGIRRARRETRAREGIAFLWINHLEQSGHEVAAKLGISAVSAYRCARRGERLRQTWLALLREEGNGK